MVTEGTKEAKEFKATAPPILEWDGQQSWQKPRLEVRYFHKKKIDVWSGYVRTRDIKGWVDNVRIELFLEKWKKDHAGALPTNEDILDWMMRDQNEEFELQELAGSIVKNGVRQPVVITSNGDLLDGNRRYFAALMRLREAEKNGDVATLTMVSQLPAYVLSPSCDKPDFESVLVEENFVDDYRKKWPNFIRARKVYEAFRDLRQTGMTKRDAYTHLMERFGVPRSRLDYYINGMDAFQEFSDFHLEEDEETGKVPKDSYDVQWKAQEFFDHFAELSKSSIQKSLTSDPEFRNKVYERIFDGDFVNFTLIRKIPAIAADRRARDKFMLGEGKKAVEEAIDWVTVTGVAKKALNNNDRITTFKRFLENLNAQEISSLDPVAVNELDEILKTVVRMAKAVHDKTGGSK
jgi:hypothetical protein